MSDDSATDRDARARPEPPDVAAGVENEPSTPRVDDVRPSAARDTRHALPDPGPVWFVERGEDGDVEWAVFEVDAGDVAGSHGARCLIFWRDECLRRVWEYPADWRALDDEALTALSWHR